ncbi:restriction endonuclease subunit S [Limosilactobacillus sp. WILCCON 0054]
MTAFKGQNAWEQRKLGEIADIVGGGTPSTKNPEYWDGDINWYSPAEIGNQIYTEKSERQITELGLKKSSAKLLPVGTVLFTSRAGIGKTAILNKEACTNQGFQSIIPRSKILNSYFLFSRTNSLKQYGETMGSGSTFVEVSGKQMSKMPLFIPNINEQSRIAKLFQSLDKTITLHEEQHRQLEQLKKALLQKMFADETGYPALRFKGFIEKWEQRKLGEIADFNPKEDLPATFEYVDLDSVSGTTMITHRTEQKSSAPSRAQRLARLGDLFYQNVRPYQKNNYLLDKTDHTYVFSTGYTQMRPIVNGYFLLTLVQRQNFVDKVLKRCTGTSYPAINSKDLSRIKVLIPSTSVNFHSGILDKADMNRSDTNEAEKIGQLFQSLDKTITLHDKKIQYLKQLKRGLLQKMFI